jgi:hypothetical protein
MNSLLLPKYRKINFDNKKVLGHHNQEVLYFFIQFQQEFQNKIEVLLKIRIYIMLFNLSFLPVNVVADTHQQ